jgi:surface polysaccharide O-acyltransferase-like enzyme
LNVLKTTQRDYGIDLLRIISMLMIVTVHVIGQGGILTAAAPFSMQYESAWMLMSFALVSVNCFVLITGYVYYCKQTRYYRLATLWIEVLFYSILVMVLIYFMFPSEFGFENFWKAVIPTFYTNGQFSRYWFFTHTSTTCQTSKPLFPMRGNLRPQGTWTTGTQVKSTCYLRIPPVPHMV